MKIIHTKDGRTLYKDDEGHWLKKDAAEKILARKNENTSSDVREPDKEDQIQKAKEQADQLAKAEKPKYVRSPELKAWSAAEEKRSKEMSDWLSSKLFAGENGTRGDFQEFYEENYLEDVAKYEFKHVDTGKRSVTAIQK